MRFLFCLWLLVGTLTASAQDTAAYTQQEVIYGRKDGMALTMLVLQPTGKTNNRGVISTVSGNWYSAFRGMDRWNKLAQTYLRRGYTVFNVVHGSQPRYSIQDAAADMKRAVQFIRYNAAQYNISPDYIGIIGGSSGGHLSLMAGLADNAGNPKAADPVERVSGKVQAVGCFFPPTDFLNWGADGLNAGGQKAFLQTMGVLGAFTFTAFDTTRKMYTEVRDTTRFNAIVKAISPAQLVTPDDAAVFIWHGDADDVVPLQQSQLLKQKMEVLKIPFVLKVKPGGKHGWDKMQVEEADFADWFDVHLKVKK